MRISTIFWLCVVFAAVIGLYQVKYKVREMKNESDSLEERIAVEKKAVHVLEAEWSYLTRPERIRELANQHLTLEPVTAAQMAMPDELSEISPASEESEIIPAKVDGSDVEIQIPASGR